MMKLIKVPTFICSRCDKEKRLTECYCEKCVKKIIVINKICNGTITFDTLKRIVKIEWKNWKENKGYECHLETGEVFKP